MNLQRIDKNVFGPWAIVTGASSGIGKEFASQLAANGLNVVLVARRISILEETGRDLAREFGVRYRAVQADLADDIFLEKVAAATDDLDVGLVVSNAGVSANREFLAAKPASLLESVQLNVVAHLRLTHHYGNRLAKRGRGGLLLVSSLMGLQGVPYMADYAAGKAFILSLGEALHRELERRGVRVTVLLPGPVDTPMLGDLGLMPADLPMRPMSVQRCVSEGLAALASGSATRVTGRMNRVMTTLMPRSMTIKMLGDMNAKILRRKDA